MADNHSEHGNNDNDNENEEVGQPVRMLRDYLQLTPSCTFKSGGVGQFEIKLGLIQLLQKFHGLDS